MSEKDSTNRIQTAVNQEGEGREKFSKQIDGIVVSQPVYNTVQPQASSQQPQNVSGLDSGASSTPQASGTSEEK